MTDIADNDMTDEPDDEFPAKPPPIEPWTVPGAEGLPDDVRNGDLEGETHPDVDHEPIIEDREN